MPQTEPFFLVIFPPAARQITAHNRLYFDRSQFLGDNRTFLNGLGFMFGQYVISRVTGKMIRHDMRQFFKPEIGNLRQNFSFTRNRIV